VTLPTWRLYQIINEQPVIFAVLHPRRDLAALLGERQA
jgi:hypothetical protein